MKLVRSRYGNCLTRTVSILDRRGIRTNLTIVEMKLPIIRVKIKLYREKFSKLASLFQVQIFLSRPSYEVNIYEAALSTLLSLVQISLLVQGEPKSGPHQYLQRSIRDVQHILGPRHDNRGCRYFHRHDPFASENWIQP